MYMELWGIARGLSVFTVLYWTIKLTLKELASASLRKERYTYGSLVNNKYG